MAVTYVERVLARSTVQPSGCIWHNTKPTSKGYAQTRIGWPETKSVLLHRLAWEYANGPIPDGMVIDHICHDPAVCAGGDSCEHRRCINPEHMRVVSESENNARTVRVLAIKGVCKRGHAFDKHGVTFADGKRECGACRRENGRNWMRKRRAALKAGV